MLHLNEQYCSSKGEIILDDFNIIGTIVPINVTTVTAKSNIHWGVDKEFLPSLTTSVGLAVTTYFSIMKNDFHLSPEFLTTCARLLERDGMVEYVKFTSDVFQSFVTKEQMNTTDELKNNFLALMNAEFKRLQPQEVSVSLRFLKRFSVRDAQLMYNESINGFIDVERTNRQLDRSDNWVQNNLPNKIMELARLYVEWLLDDFAITSDIIQDNIQSCNFSITAKGVSDYCYNPLHRIAGVMLHYDTPFKSIGINNTMNMHRYDGIEDIFNIPDNRCVTLSAVPKDVKSYRLICPDDPYRLVCQTIICNEIIRCIRSKGMENNLPIFDQGVMRDLAYRSIHGEIDYATIDESHASDSVRRNICYAIWPNKVISLLMAYLPTHISVNGRRNFLSMLSTMGSGNTLLTQSITFWALDCAIVHYCMLVSGSLPKGGFKLYQGQRIYPFTCYAMGDDQQIPRTFVDECIDIQSRLGFTVNVSKSFFDDEHYFRESCGAEAIDMDPYFVDTYYWPRKPITAKFMPSTNVKVDSRIGDFLSRVCLSDDGFRYENTSSIDGSFENSITIMVKLSHRLYLAGCTHTAQLLSRWLIATVPNMTASQIGEPTDDVWLGCSITSQVRNHPIGKFVSRWCTNEIHSSNQYAYTRASWKRVLIGKQEDERLSSLFPKAYTPMQTKQYALHMSIVARSVDTQPSFGYSKNGARKEYSTCPICASLNVSGDAKLLASHITELVEIYCYQQYLRLGPSYNSELDRLLGVSTRRNYGSIMVPQYKLD